MEKEVLLEPCRDLVLNAVRAYLGPHPRQWAWTRHSGRVYLLLLNPNGKPSRQLHVASRLIWVSTDREHRSVWRAYGDGEPPFEVGGVADM